MTTTPLPQAYYQTWWALMLRGVVTCTLGLLLLAWPFASVVQVAHILAVWVCVGGGIQALHAAALRGALTNWWVMLLSGLVSAVFGVAALWHSAVLTLALLVSGTAGWFLLVGGFSIVLAMQEQASGLPWSGTFSRGVLKVIVGLTAVITPAVTLTAFIGLLATFAGLSGLTLFVAALQLRLWPRDSVDVPDRAGGIVVL